MLSFSRCLLASGKEALKWSFSFQTLVLVCDSSTQKSWFTMNIENLWWYQNLSMMIMQEFSMYLKCRLKWINEFDHRILALLKQQREGPENPGLNWDSNPDLCDTEAKLHPLNYQANWTESRSLCGSVIRFGRSRCCLSSAKMQWSNPHFKDMENSGIIIIYLLIYGLITDPYNDQISVGLIAQLAALKCDDQIHSFIQSLSFPWHATLTFRHHDFCWHATIQRVRNRTPSNTLSSMRHRVSFCDFRSDAKCYGSVNSTKLGISQCKVVWILPRIPGWNIQKR